MPRNQFILITGGSRSGKSRLAVRMAKALGRTVIYLATCRVCDNEMRARVRCHRRERPSHWRTIEHPKDVVRQLQQLDGAEAVIFDCLTMYVSELMMRGVSEARMRRRIAQLCEAIRKASCPVIVVTNEVGSSVVPEHPLGRRFRDMAGLANQLAARAADQVVLMVAGIPVRIKGDALDEVTHVLRY